MMEQRLTEQSISSTTKYKTIARVSNYLNFPNNTEEVSNFYKTVFGGRQVVENIVGWWEIEME